MPKAGAQSESWVALLGRRDTPTDGVEDYCTYLGRALSRRGAELEQSRVVWPEKGWFRALRELWQESSRWRDTWVLLQYTTMAWSRRGFPFGALAALAILRRREVRCAVVFHEPIRQNGDRWVDYFRGACQDWVIRKLYRGATRAIFVDPLEKIEWLPAKESKSVFVPIGANIPEARSESIFLRNHNGEPRTVVVFCLSDPPNRRRELDDIAHAMRFSAQQGLKARVVFLGRGTAEAKEEIEEAFDSIPVEAVNFGLQSADSISRVLSEADAMLCVRGPLYSRRASAIAGIACGLPIVGYSGLAAGTPLEDAGVQLVPYRHREALGPALAGVLTDNRLQTELRGRSLRAHETHFSWDVIASKLLNALNRGEQAKQ